ncbi:cytochrome P450 3A41 [Rhipicephalus sanguineus]|uniref:cytochrome P450 3A41 n=1 Tax=Rhipicephalus sanguineus TaxID=34632 RepID=UPI0020C2F59D|nr:cytochrome P450 3A41 [Rhipicephalus sanguineus]
MLHAILLVLLSIVFLIVGILAKTFTFWKGKGIPYLSFFEYIRAVRDNFTGELNKVALRNYKRYGRIYGSYQGLIPSLVVSDPDVLREICVKDFKSFVNKSDDKVSGNTLWDQMVLHQQNEEWKNTRSSLSPMFTTAKLKSMVPKMTKTMDRFTKLLLTKLNTRQPANLCQLLEKSAMDLYTSLIFDLDIDSHVDTEHPMLKCYSGFLSAPGGWRLLMMTTLPRLFKAFRVEFPNKGDSQYALDFTKHLIERRLRENEKHDDALQMYMDTKMQQNGKGGVQLSESAMNDISAQCMCLFIAGSDSIALTVTCAAYSLALHPDIQEAVINEVDAAASIFIYVKHTRARLLFFFTGRTAPDHKRLSYLRPFLSQRLYPKPDEATYESLRSMVLLDAVVSETLRMYSPTSVLTRICSRSTTIAGVRFTPGMRVEIPAHAMHYDPEFFPEPESFKPERFLPEHKDSINTYTYLPFGVGPRSCIGMRMGMVQVKYILYRLLQNVTFEPCAETQVPLSFAKGKVLLEPNPPIQLKIVPRARRQSSGSSNTPTAQG